MKYQLVAQHEKPAVGYDPETLKEAVITELAAKRANNSAPDLLPDNQKDLTSAQIQIIEANIAMRRTRFTSVTEQARHTRESRESRENAIGKLKREYQSPSLAKEFESLVKGIISALDGYSKGRG